MVNQNEIEIDLVDLVRHLMKKCWIIIAASMVCGILGLMTSCFLIPYQYEASTRMYILSRTSGEVVSYTDYQISDRMLADYKVLITGQNVTKQVLQELELEMTVQDLEKMIAVTAPDNTRVVQITVLDRLPQRAADIANSVREVASVQIQQIMDVEAVNLVYAAEAPEEPVKPNKINWTIGAAMLGLVLSVVLIAARHLADDSIRTEEDVERYLGIGVLGVIPMSRELEERSANQLRGSHAEHKLFGNKRK